MVDQMEPSIAIFRESLAAAEEQSDPAETVRFAVLLANALIDVDDFAAAGELLERTVTLAPDSKDPIFRARVYWSHSRLHTLQGDPVQAARYARKALNLLELTEHTYYTAVAHQLLAHIEVDRKRPEEALELVEKGLELLGDSGSPDRPGAVPARGSPCVDPARPARGGRLDRDGGVGSARRRQPP